MADSTNQNKSPLEIAGAQYVSDLLPKNEYNVGNPEPLTDGDSVDENSIGTIGTKADIGARLNALKFNKFSADKQYPNF